MFNASFRILILASVVAFVAAQPTADPGATFCCPTTEDSLDHPPKQMAFVKAVYELEPQSNSMEEDGSDYDSIPKETVLSCSYDGNVTCVFRAKNGEVKTVYDSMCHTPAVKVQAKDVSSNAYCAKPLPKAGKS